MSSNNKNNIIALLAGAAIGVGLGFLFAPDKGSATRQKLIALGYLSANTPTLSDSLDFVAVGTIADCTDATATPAAAADWYALWVSAEPLLISQHERRQAAEAAVRHRGALLWVVKRWLVAKLSDAR